MSVSTSASAPPRADRPPVRGAFYTRPGFWVALAVVAAGVVSALVVRRRIDRLDMVAALKTRE